MCQITVRLVSWGNFRIDFWNYENFQALNATKVNIRLLLLIFINKFRLNRLKDIYIYPRKMLHFSISSKFSNLNTMIKKMLEFIIKHHQQKKKK